MSAPSLPTCRQFIYNISKPSYLNYPNYPNYPKYSNTATIATTPRTPPTLISRWFAYNNIIVHFWF